MSVNLTDAINAWLKTVTHGSVDAASLIADFQASAEHANRQQAKLPDTGAMLEELLPLVQRKNAVVAQLPERKADLQKLESAAQASLRKAMLTLTPDDLNRSKADIAAFRSALDQATGAADKGDLSASAAAGSGIGDAAAAAVGGEVGAGTGAAAGSGIGDAAAAAVGGEVGAGTGAAAGGGIGDATAAAVGGEVEAGTGAAAGSGVDAAEAAAGASEWGAGAASAAGLAAGALGAPSLMSPRSGQASAPPVSAHPPASPVARPHAASHDPATRPADRHADPTHRAVHPQASHAVAAQAAGCAAAAAGTHPGPAHGTKPEKPLPHPDVLNDVVKAWEQKYAQAKHEGAAVIAHIRKSFANHPQAKHILHTVEKGFETAFGLNTPTGPLAQKLIEIGKAHKDDATKVMTEARHIVHEHIKHIASNPVLRAIESNPHVPVKIRQHLVEGLEMVLKII